MSGEIGRGSGFLCCALWTGASSTSLAETNETEKGKIMKTKKYEPTTISSMCHDDPALMSWVVEEREGRKVLVYVFDFEKVWERSAVGQIDSLHMG